MFPSAFWFMLQVMDHSEFITLALLDCTFHYFISGRDGVGSASDLFYCSQKRNHTGNNKNFVYIQRWLMDRKRLPSIWFFHFTSIIFLPILIKKIHPQNGEMSEKLIIPLYQFRLSISLFEFSWNRIDNSNQTIWHVHF